MGRKCKLTVPGRFEHLAAIADFISKVGCEADFAQDTIFHVQMAVDEACSNVIEHAYGGQDRGKIKLSSECRKNEWVITIQDTGRPFNHQVVPKPDLNIKLDDIKTGGLGLYFMNQLMDNVEFTFGNRGNRLRMVKREV